MKMRMRVVLAALCTAVVVGFVVSPQSSAQEQAGLIRGGAASPDGNEFPLTVVEIEASTTVITFPGGFVMIVSVSRVKCGDSGDECGWTPEGKPKLKG